ncbi:hypothetical protein AVEN_45462-1 [Araneus ventricosus]|uniref:Uncharacterized protein n=1 Tax=Araneus ventricosus TaxID=182803 RepID=A0A4Y2PZ73_ARAVE|nr:hypothetical protein AVEN_45462-1 [Araneus ventricosus]
MHLNVVTEHCIKFEIGTRFGATRSLFWKRTSYVMLNRNQMTRTTPEPATHSPSFRTTPAVDIWPPTYDLACNMSTYVFSGIGFRTWNPPAPKLRS